MVAALAALAPTRSLAWDCATGSGQAAALLAPHFDRVIATDASADQVAHARSVPNVEYRVARAEQSGIDSASVDLITVAQALHWFEFDAFFNEAERVLRPSGILAVWMYFRVVVAPEVDAIIEWFFRDRVGAYWPPERRHVEAGYSTIPFPYAGIDTGSWAIESALDRRALTGYVASWSAVARCRAAEGRDPVLELDEMLAAVWPEASESRHVTWPLLLRVGRRPAALARQNPHDLFNPQNPLPTSARPESRADRALGDGRPQRRQSLAQAQDRLGADL